MKYKRPLVNPTPYEFEQRKQITQEADYNYNAPAEGQLKLSVGKKSDNVRQYWGSFLHFVKRRKDVLEVDALWKSASLPFAFVTCVSLIITTMFVGIVFFDKIPPKIPFFYNNVERSWEQVDKLIVLIFPLVIGLVELVAIHFTTLIFRNDKRLAKTFFWVLTLINVMFYIAIVQIYTLTL